MAGDAAYTIGHSTRTLEELVGILLEAGVRELVDVRTEPRSDNEAFQGYADHLGDPDFAAALDRLQAGARRRPTTVMCAEAQWWR